MKKQNIWSALGKSLGYLALFFLAQFAAGFLTEFTVVLSFLWKGEKMTEELFYAAYYSVAYETMLLSVLLFFGALALMRKNVLPVSGVRKTTPWSVLSGFFLGFGAYYGALIIINIMNSVPQVQQSQADYMAQQNAITAAGSNFWVEALYACAIGPFVEELLCRGLVQNTLRKSVRPAVAVFLSGALFALMHGNLYQAVFTLPLGLLLGFVAYRFDSIWPSLALHVAFNASNYPVIAIEKLGFGPESAQYEAFTMIFTLFLLGSIPIGIGLFVRATKAKPAPAISSEPAYFSQSTPRSGENIESFQGGNMAAPEYLVVGLGNPGSQYASNRHNCGFIALDYIALREKVTCDRLRFRSLTGEAILGGRKVLLLKPQTFMNLSGQAVREAAAFYKIPPEKILVIFDDISFAPGAFRIRASGSAGGHNGIKSIIQELGSDKFPRVKMGVGAPPEGWDLMHWVLGDPSKEDLDRIVSSLEDVYATACLFAEGNLDRAAAQFNGKTR